VASHRFLGSFAKRSAQLRAYAPRPKIRVNRTSGETNAVFIVGSGRSGTTLLRRLLMENGDIYIPPETYVLGPTLQGAQKLRSCEWEDLVSYVAGRFEYEPEFYHFRIDSLRKFALEQRSLGTDRRSLECLLDGLYRHFGHEEGCDRAFWGDKTPYNTFFLPEISAVFPGAKFIGMQRDGCDVVVSYVKAGIYGDYEAAAHRWIESNILLERFREKNAHCLMLLRYEDLIAETDVHLDKVLAFTGIPKTRDSDNADAPQATLHDAHTLPHLKKSLAPVDATNSGKGVRILREEASEKLRDLMNPWLKKLGYEEI